MSSKPPNRECERRASAHCACQIIVEAYARGEACGGSIDWVDLDLAHERAAQALTPLERRRIERRVRDAYTAQEA